MIFHCVLSKIIIRILGYGNGTVNETKNIFKSKFYFRFKIGDAMSTPTIQDEEAARLREEAAAAVRAANDDRNRRPGSGPPAPPPPLAALFKGYCPPSGNRA